MDFIVKIYRTDIGDSYSNVSKLPFLQLSGAFNYLACEFIDSNSNKLAGVLYMDYKEPYNFYGYGLLGEYIGKGLGQQMLEDILLEVSLKLGVKKFTSKKMRCNEYSKALMNKMKKNAGKIKIEETDEAYNLVLLL